eukprot:4517197-Ditylum_brightwellii.AAC.1
MEVAKEVLVQMGKEGIKELEDLVELSKEIWKQVVENLKRPGDQMKNPDRVTNQSHVTFPQTLYLFWARTQKRILEASELMRYYKIVG